MKITRTLAAVAVTASFLLASCGGGGGDDKASGGDDPTTTAAGDEPTTTAEGGGGGGAGGSAVKIVDFKYDPDPLEVEAGTAVKFTNEDDAAHTATSSGDVPKDFDTGNLEKGDSKEVTFDEAGSYTYICDIHNYMKGTVDVK